jgi:transposase-like protein
MSKKLTEEQKQEYLKCGGSKCPHCGSTNIEGAGHDYDANWVSQEITCANCRESWKDVFVLTTVEAAST